VAGRHGRRLPVVRVLAVRTDAVQRPSGEPAPVVDPAAQRAGNRRAGKILLPGITHDARTFTAAPLRRSSVAYPNGQVVTPRESATGTLRQYRSSAGGGDLLPPHVAGNGMSMAGGPRSLEAPGLLPHPSSRRRVSRVRPATRSMLLSAPSRSSENGACRGRFRAYRAGIQDSRIPPRAKGLTGGWFLSNGRNSSPPS
jgi:hypothetical protein